MWKLWMALIIIILIGVGLLARGIISDAGLTSPPAASQTANAFWQDRTAVNQTEIHDISQDELVKALQLWEIDKKVALFISGNSLKLVYLPNAGHPEWQDWYGVIFPKDPGRLVKPASVEGQQFTDSELYLINLNLALSFLSQGKAPIEVKPEDPISDQAWAAAIAAAIKVRDEWDEPRSNLFASYEADLSEQEVNLAYLKALLAYVAEENRHEEVVAPEEHRHEEKLLLIGMGKLVQMNAQERAADAWQQLLLALVLIAFFLSRGLNSRLSRPSGTTQGKP